MVNSTGIRWSKLIASGTGNEYSIASESELLLAARGSDGRAFAELCSRHAAPIQRRIFRMLRNQEDAEDVLQDSICKAFVNLQRFRGSCTFSVWLTQIAINSALMLMRKRRVRSEVSCDCQTDHEQEWLWDFPDRSPNAEQLFIRQQALERMSVAVDRLPCSYRELVKQYHGAERSLEEAANSLGLNLSTAKARLLRARRMMRTSLSRQRISFADACR